MSAPVLSSAHSTAHSPLHELLSLSGVSEHCAGDFTQSSLSTFQTAELDLSCNAELIAPLDPWASDGNVLLLCVGVGCVNHNGVKLDTLVGKAEDELELLLIGCVVQVDGNGH